jgi:FlaA1/EpsC-like NDP-sugar epimerase
MSSEAFLRHRRKVIVATHLALVPTGYWAAFALRFDTGLPPELVPVFLTTLPALVILRMAAYGRLGLFRGYWQHFGMHDLITLAKAVTLSSLGFAIALVLAGQLGPVPRSIILIDWLLAVFLSGGVHFAARCVREGRIPWKPQSGKRTLIIGAGEAAERLLREFRQDARLDIRPVGLVDDNPGKWKRILHGVPVLGPTTELSAFVARYRIELLVIAIPSASREQMRRIVNRCVETKVEFRVVRPLHELMDGRARMSQLRSVQLEDLLGRPPVEFDLDAVTRDIEGSVVLVTGGAGSIGSELARQIARLRPARLVLLEQAESPLYFTQLELRRAHPDLDVVSVIGGITDEARLDHVFAVHRPQHVFHAAAYKHVPLMETNVPEAVRNNVFGTLRVAQAAARHGVARFVLLSTDKAVYPSSVMGATKRIAERIILGCPELRSSGTDFRAVRFGNVLGSDGSVIPLFRRQLAIGGPLTVTHPEVTRYFMTIPEAVQLVLQAAVLPEAAGRIAMLDMGKPVKIIDLAENLIRLSGLEPYADVKISFTGLRPGEKLHEDLMSTFEESVPTTVKKIRILQHDETDGVTIERLLDHLAAALVMGSDRETLRAIRELVPECVTPLRESPSITGGSLPRLRDDGSRTNTGFPTLDLRP